MLKSRMGKLPPANFYAQIYAYLAAAYPKATLNAKLMGGLQPIWDQFCSKGAAQRSLQSQPAVAMASG